MSEGSSASSARPRQFGKYLLLEKIGSGGMAEIFKAVVQGAEDFRKVLVIKRILLPYSKDPNFVKMFVDEAKITAPLQHANVVAIHEFDQVDGQYYLAMEFIHGRDLQQVMARANRLGREIPTSVALYVVGEVCKALWYAYNARDPFGNPLKIIHRDVSPSNVLLSYDGEVKVTDFGVARAATSREQGAGILKGKLGYMSPEQVTGREMDHRSDLFSLGIILFECLTLKRLFLGRTDLQTLVNIRDADVERRLARHPEIPGPVQDILRRALAREPEHRYANAQAFLNDIQDYLFSTGKRVGSDTVAALMHDLFPEEAEAEILPLDIEELSEVRLRDTGHLRVATAAAPRTSPEPRPAPPPERPPVAREAPEDLPVETEAPAVEVTRKDSAFRPQSVFYLQDADGGRFGPITLNNLLSLIRSHAVHEEELCSVDGGPFVKLKAITALQPHFQAGHETVVPRKMLCEGTIQPESVVSLVFDLMRRKRLNGVLVFRRGSSQKEVFFRDGRPRNIFSNQRQELFGEFLVARGFVTREQIEQAIRSCKDEKFRLGDALIAQGLLSAHDLAHLLEWQFKERFLDLFRWNRGWYGVFEQEGPPAGAVAFDLDPMPTLAEAVRSVVGIGLIRMALDGKRDQVLIRNPSARVGIPEFRLLPREMRIVHLLESYPSLAQVVANLPSRTEAEEQAYRVVYLLLQTEVYRFKAARPGRGPTGT